MPPWHVQENKWRAARYGLDAVIILDADSNERLVTEDLDDLLTRLAAGGRIAWTAPTSWPRSPRSTRTGASYQRQRRVAEDNDGDLRRRGRRVGAELDL